MDSDFWVRLMARFSELDLAQTLVSAAAGVAGLIVVALVGYSAKFSFSLAKKTAQAVLGKTKAKSGAKDHNLYQSVDAALASDHCRKVDKEATLSCGSITVGAMAYCQGYPQGVKVVIDNEDVTTLLKARECKYLRRKLTARLDAIKKADEQARLDLFAARARQELVTPSKVAPKKC